MWSNSVTRQVSYKLSKLKKKLSNFQIMWRTDLLPSFLCTTLDSEPEINASCRIVVVQIVPIFLGATSCGAGLEFP